MLNIVLLGPPGSGKGTQAELLAAKFNLCHISTGQLLRQAIAQKTSIGMTAQAAIAAGQLVADQVIIELISNEIRNMRNYQGFIIDGFPRNLDQTKALVTYKLVINWVIYLEIADQLIIERLAGRRSHPGSGRTYHVKYHPPKVAEIDDLSGEPLMIRDDDKPETIIKRLEVYHKNTEPMIAWYRLQAEQQGLKFLTIDATLPKLELFDAILANIQ